MTAAKTLSLRNLALWGLFLDAFGYAVLGVNSRLLSTGFEPLTQVYVRIAIGFLLSLVIFNKHIRLPKLKTMPKSDVFWLIVMGTLGYSISVWMITLANLSAKLVNASIIFASIPLVVYVYSYFLLKEKLRWKVILLLFVALYGIVVVASKSFLPHIESFGKGELFAFLSVLAGGWWSLGRKKMSEHLNNQEITVLTMLIAAVSGAAIALLKGEPLPLQSFTLLPVIIGVAIGAVLNIGSTFLENFCFSHLNVVLGSQILMTSSIFALVLGFLLYHEVVSLPEVLGGILIFASVWWGNRLLPNE